MSRLVCVALCAVLFACTPSTLHAAGSVRTVALSGQLAPGGGGATFSNFNSSIELLGAGRGAFSAKLSIGPGGVTTTSDSGIWSEKGGALNLVVREGEAAPGTSAGVLFGELSVGRWNSSGALAFESALQAGTGGVTSSNDTGIWANVGNGLQLIAREGSPAPGTPSGVVFGDSFLGPNLNADGELALTANLKTGVGPVTTADNEGIWVMRGGQPLSLLVREGQQTTANPVPVTIGGSNLDLTNLSYPEIDLLGRVSFNGHFIEGGTGFWSERTGNLELTYRSGMQAPDAVPGVKFFSFGGFPYTNANGRYSDQHTLTGGDVSGVFENGRGIYNDATGELKEIARGGQPAPGTAAGTLFGFLSPPSFNDLGQSSFFGILRNAASSIPTTANEGFWSDASGTLKLIVREGDAAPGIDSGAVVGPIDLHAYRPTLNNVGQSAFPLKLLQGVGGVTVDNDTGYWAQDVTGALRLIIREGDQLTVAPGDIRTIASFGLNGDARSFRFDDLGNLMFRANFTDGSQGLFIANVPVPEPASWAILLLTVAFTGAALRRRLL